MILIMNKKIMLVVMALCLSVFVGCQSSVKTSNDKSSETKVTVGTWKTAQTIQPFMYGKFIDEKYKLEVIPFTNPGDQKTALLAGDLSYTGTNVVTAIIAASKGEPVVVVSNLCNKCAAFVVRKDSNIKTTADLKGKKIAYVPSSIHHILLLELLERAGLDPAKDVELKKIEFFDMGQALAQGEIDAFLSGEPFPSIATKEGYGRILEYPYYEESIGYINGAMLTTKDEIKNNRQKIQDLVTAHAKTSDFLMKNKKEWLDKAAEFGTDRGVLDNAVDNMELAWDMDEKYIQNIKNLANRMKELGIISEVPNIDELIDLSFVEQARKEVEK